MWEVDVIHSIAPGVWGIEDDLFMPGGLHFPVRMTVVKLPSGGLLLHSPVKIDDQRATALAELGPVEHLVAPNALHHLFFGDAQARYPDAVSWAAPGLAEKRKDLRFDHILSPAGASAADEPPPWGDVLEAHFVDGIPWANETVFLHRPSKTLVVTDLFFNLQAPPNRISRFFFWLLGVLGKPKQSPLLRWKTKDKAAAAAACRQILQWSFDRVVPAHGRVVEDDAERVLAEVLAPMIARAPAAVAARASG